MKKTIILVLCFCVLSVTVYAHNTNYTHSHFDNGLLNVIDAANSVDTEVYVDVYNNINPGTHLKIVEGGSVDPSDRPSYSGISLYNNSKFTMTGGIVHGRISTLDNVHVSMTAGHIMESFYIQENSTGEISGGTIDGRLEANGKEIKLSGGTVKEFVAVAPDTIFRMSGGTIEGFLITSSSFTYVTGGEIQGHIYAGYGSHTTIRGGSLGGDFIFSRPGKITLVGSDFKVDGNTIDFGQYDTSIYGSTYHQITGTLASGDLLNTRFRIRDEGAVLEFLQVPEPATITLLALGVMIVRKRMRK